MNSSEIVLKQILSFRLGSAANANSDELVEDAIFQIALLLVKMVIVHCQILVIVMMVGKANNVKFQFVIIAWMEFVALRKSVNALLIGSVMAAIYQLLLLHVKMDERLQLNNVNVLKDTLEGYVMCVNFK